MKTLILLPLIAKPNQLKANKKLIAYSTELVSADLWWYMQSKLRFNFQLIIVTIKNVVSWLKLDVKNTDKLIVTAVINFLG